ncbi:MAG TPA: hypothetical protein DCP95_11025, partial [Microbacterium ginsengisoli]|nr:hypothetical protein [Microbacterium ginsengisoli]
LGGERPPQLGARCLDGGLRRGELGRSSPLRGPLGLLVGDPARVGEGIGCRDRRGIRRHRRLRDRGTPIRRAGEGTLEIGGVEIGWL